MQAVASELEWAVRLSGQLETLSELAEHLTYRVLELEERLAAQDRQLTSLQTASDLLTTGMGEAIEERMQATEDRMARIEGLLKGSGQRNSHPRVLRALTRPSVPGQHSLASADSAGEESLEEPLFLDDGHGDHYSDDPQGEVDLPLAVDPFEADHLDQSLAS